MTEITISLGHDDVHGETREQSLFTSSPLSLDEVICFPERFVGQRLALRRQRFMGFRRYGGFVSVGVRDLWTGTQSPVDIPRSGLMDAIAPSSVTFAMVLSMAEFVVPYFALHQYAEVEFVCIIKPTGDGDPDAYIALIIEAQSLDENGTMLRHAGFQERRFFPPPAAESPTGDMASQDNEGKEATEVNEAGGDVPEAREGSE